MTVTLRLEGLSTKEKIELSTLYEKVGMTEPVFFAEPALVFVDSSTGWNIKFRLEAKDTLPDLKIGDLVVCEDTAGFPLCQGCRGTVTLLKPYYVHVRVSKRPRFCYYKTKTCCFHEWRKVEDKAQGPERKGKMNLYDLRAWTPQTVKHGAKVVVSKEMLAVSEEAAMRKLIQAIPADCDLDTVETRVREVVNG